MNQEKQRSREPLALLFPRSEDLRKFKYTREREKTRKVLVGAWAPRGFTNASYHVNYSRKNFLLVPIGSNATEIENLAFVFLASIIGLIATCVHKFLIRRINAFLPPFERGAAALNASLYNVVFVQQVNDTAAHCLYRSVTARVIRMWR